MVSGGSIHILGGHYLKHAYVTIAAFSLRLITARMVIVCGTPLGQPATVCSFYITRNFTHVRQVLPLLQISVSELHRHAHNYGMFD